MKVWTVQSREVLDIIKKERIYHADFGWSPYLRNNRDLGELYGYMLESFNNINKQNLNGLVFCFAEEYNGTIQGIEGIEEFKDFINDNRFPIHSYWKNINKKNSVLFQLEIDITEFNPLAIDINDFQALMPPITVIPPFTQEVLGLIIAHIQLGRIHQPVFPSQIFQLHIPCIRYEDVVSVHEVFE